MAEKRSAYASPELAKLQSRLQELEATLAKRRAIEEDLQQANARLQAEAAQLRAELEDTRRAQRRSARELARKEKRAGRRKSSLAKASLTTTNVADFSQHDVNLAGSAWLETLSGLAPQLAHELNQPLTAISAYAHAALPLLDKAAVDRQEVRRLLEHIAAQAERAGELIRCIRRFTRGGPPERVLLNLNDSVQEALQLIELELKKQRVQVVLRLAPDLPQVLADPVQIVQVMSNLLSNAVTAMCNTPEGQRLLTITTRSTGSEVQVAVSDAGEGISVAGDRNLFKAFRTTRLDGMGLGLVLSRKLVEAHNGRMWVEPNPQRGTTFFVALMLSQP